MGNEGIVKGWGDGWIVMTEGMDDSGVAREWRVSSWNADNLLIGAQILICEQNSDSCIH